MIQLAGGGPDGTREAGVAFVGSGTLSIKIAVSLSRSISRSVSRSLADDYMTSAADRRIADPARPHLSYPSFLLLYPPGRMNERESCI